MIKAFKLYIKSKTFILIRAMWGYARLNKIQNQIFSNKIKKL